MRTISQHALLTCARVIFLHALCDIDRWELREHDGFFVGAVCERDSGLFLPGSKNDLVVGDWGSESGVEVKVRDEFDVGVDLAATLSEGAIESNESYVPGI